MAVDTHDCFRSHGENLIETLGHGVTLTLGGAALFDIAEDHHDPGEFSVVVADGSGAVIDLGFAAGS